MEREAAKCISLTLTDHVGLRVAVANDDHVHNPCYCHHIQMLIGDEDFVIDCYRLALRSYDMVLGVQWLESLGPIL
jgi:hypothetical protein